MASSTLFEKTHDFKQYRYHVVTIQFKTNGKKKEVIDIPTERLVKFNIMNLYEYNAFPLFKISMALESSVYYKILKNKNKGKLYLRIDSYYIYMDDSEPSRYSTFIKDNFDIVLDEDTDDMLAAQKEMEAGGDYTTLVEKDTDELRHIEDGIFTAYLFKTDVVNGTKYNISTVLQNVTVTDAIAYCLNKAKIKNVLMAPPDNVEMYDEMLLPPLTTIRELSFIDSYYGIYQEGTMIYFGLNYNYIIPYNGKCEAYVNKEKSIISILVPDSSNKHFSVEGELENANSNGKHVYLVASYHSVDIENQSISNDYTTGNDMYLLDDYDGESTEEVSNATSKSEKNNVMIFENNTENPYIASMYAAQSKALSTVIHLTVDHTNVEWLEPNRKYNVIFEDAKYASKYKGNYIVTEVISNFEKDGLDFGVSTILTLKHE